MTDARAEVLARIRRALGDAPPPPPDVARDYRRGGEHPPGAPALLDLLVDRLRDYRATVHRTTESALPGTLADVLAETLPPGGRLVVPPGLPAGWAPEDAVVDDGRLQWTEPAAPGPSAASAAPGQSAEPAASGRWAGLDRIDAVLTACAAAAAETGTIVLDGSPDQGRRAITLIPDRHVCVVHAAQVVHTVPELLARLDPVRPLTFVSGPSATSDIELRRVEGVHGPRTLVVVVVSPDQHPPQSIMQ